ncbi:MAG: pyridoxal-phosphate dependent enzyme, partial [Deltaproteobacteria bacterium]|nr:pyridoxal-phosphate dependent enzyme [Deltaproteobacteria bacterium]
VKLNRVGAGLPANLYVKCENLSPGGSSKDRMARHLLDVAEREGRLSPGATIVEATTGNAGAGLAMHAAVRAYKCVFVMPDKTSPEKIAALRAFGARVVVCPAVVEPDDPRSHMQVAKRIAAETPNAFFANQHDNPANPEAHYLSTGPEIWAQCGDELDVLVAGLGTGGTLTGAGRFLREKKPGIKLIGVDPVGSLFHDYRKSGRVTKAVPYEVEGIGSDFVPSTIDLSLLDEVVRVDDKECFLTTRDLVRQEGLFVGGSSGAAVAGAIKHAAASGRADNVLVLLPDGAQAYLARIFDDEWMREHGFLDEEDVGLGVVADLLRNRAGEVITAKTTDRVRDVIARMKAHGISQLPTVDSGKLVGAVTEVDLLRYLVSGEHSLDSPVGPLVESEYATVTKNTRIELVQNLLSDTRMAIVLDGDRLAGVITKIDLIDYLARRAS